ncbi:MAG: hypothetical protein ABFS17_10755 [Chloroflexota bacterium]
MDEKKTKSLNNIIPNVILVFVLLCTLLIVFEISGNLVNEGVFQFENEERPTLTVEVEETPSGPLPTPEPIIDA